MAADTLGSYGSMARFPDLNRIMKVFHERTYSHRIFSCGCQCPSPPSPASRSRPSMFTSFPFQVNDTTVLGAGGDYADFQFISDVSFIGTVFFTEWILHQLCFQTLISWLFSQFFNSILQVIKLLNILPGDKTEADWWGLQRRWL